jgi:hypothetical protein
MMLEDVSLSLNLLKIFTERCATLLAQQCEKEELITAFFKKIN